MKQWIKNWWFSIVMWLFAITILVYVIIVDLFEEELLLHTLTLLSCITPVMLLTTIGFISVPKKGEQNER